MVYFSIIMVVYFSIIIYRNIKAYIFNLANVTHLFVGIIGILRENSVSNKDQGDRSLIFYFERGRDSGVKATSVFSSG